MGTKIERQWDHDGVTCVVILIDFELPANLRSVHMEGAHRCGYAGVKAGHALFEIDYASAPNDIDVHGGLTFSGKLDAIGASPDIWFLGFDCAHYGDSLRKWSEDAVANEVERLADQIRSVGPCPHHRNSAGRRESES